VDDECTLHISIVLAICMPQIIKFGGYLTKFWQKSWVIFGTLCKNTRTTWTDPSAQPAAVSAAFTNNSSAVARGSRPYLLGP